MAWSLLDLSYEILAIQTAALGTTGDIVMGKSNPCELAIGAIRLNNRWMSFPVNGITGAIQISPASMTLPDSGRFR